MTDVIRHLLSPVGADAYLPGHGDPSYDVNHYDLAVDYKLEGNQLIGKARIDAVAREDLGRFTLDLDSLRVTKVSIAGIGVAKYASHRGKVIVTTKTTVKSGQRFSVVVSYGGNPKTSSGKAGEFGWEELADGVLVAGQPGGAPSWFPCNDRPSSKASYRIAVTAPSHYYVVANGQLVDNKQRASTTTWVYDQRAPMASYLATVQIGRYVKRSVAQKPVRVWAVVPQRLGSRLAPAFGKQAEMMKLFTRVFGPYPFDDYTVVITDDELEIPLEAQGLSIFGSNFLGSEWATVRLVAHELAHQWFGNSLTLKEWRDIWLHEGFACYAEWLWSQESGGRSTQHLAAESWKSLAEQPHDIVVGDPSPRHMFDDRVYKRGALTLHAIRLTVGDRPFFAMLRAWVKANTHGTVSTGDFVRFATRHTGNDLSNLCRSWLMREALPQLPRARKS